MTDHTPGLVLHVNGEPEPRAFATPMAATIFLLDLLSPQQLQVLKASAIRGSQNRCRVVTHELAEAE